MQSFVFTAHPARVLFGAGRTSELAAEAQLLGVKRPLVLTTPEQRTSGERLAALLAPAAVRLFDGAAMHTPTNVTQCALELLRTHAADGLIAIGGGSAIGLGKALSLRTGLPQIVIPTTYAGSEVTPILGETEKGVKRTQNNSALLPRVVIYDLEHTLSLSPVLSASSGLNAIAHAAEALYASNANPITSLMAEEGIRALSQSLPVIHSHPYDVDARAKAQYGAWLCGTCLGTVGMALHHKICHVLGGTFDLPHAPTHALILPYALAYNAPAAPQAMSRIARALGEHDAPWWHLHTMLATLGLPLSLRALGMTADQIDLATTLILRKAYWNPQPVEEEAIRRLLEGAFEGVPPHPDHHD